MTRLLVATTPREGFAHQISHLQSLYQSDYLDFDHLVIECSPDVAVRAETSNLASQYGFTLFRYKKFVVPGHAREIARQYALHRNYEYILFVDNDVLLAKNAIQNLLSHAKANNCSAVSPVICQGETPFREIHAAGGACHVDQGEFIEKINLQGVPLSAASISSGPTELFEFHCVLLQTSDLPEFDQLLYNTREHLDLSLYLQSQNRRIELCAGALVSYLPPRLKHLSDFILYSLRWSSHYKKLSLNHFSQKWSIKLSSLLAKRPLHSPRRKVIVSKFLEIIAPYAADTTAAEHVLMTVEPLCNDFLSLLLPSFYEEPNPRQSAR